MGDKTGIRWTDATDNPIRVRNPQTGKFGGFWCVKVSPGCTHCYAAREVARGRWGEPIPYVDGPNRPELYLEQRILDGWAIKTRPKRRFVSSMTDICGEFIPDEWYWQILEAQYKAPRQTFLNLTKRTDRMSILTAAWMESIGPLKAPVNMWMGFSAENQEWFDKRWACMRPMAEYDFLVWLSAEPLLGQIELPDSFLSLNSKAWCIVGGESGPHARPMNPKWARNLRDQCVEAGVPFFFKQWGEYLPVFNSYTTEDGYDYAKVGKHSAGYLLDGQEWSQTPPLREGGW